MPHEDRLIPSSFPPTDKKSLLALPRVWRESEARSTFPIRAMMTQWRVEINRGWAEGTVRCQRRVQTCSYAMTGSVL
jgi:hypothetical protein